MTTGWTAMIAAALVGCGTSGFDPDARSGDALPACAARDLELGRCVGATGVACTGAIGEVRAFAALVAGGEVELVVGPQGSAMFVLAARTTAIVPGDLDDPASAENPIVELVVVDEHGAQVARYLGRNAFAADGAWLVAPGLFVVADQPDLAGAALLAHGELTDVAGTRRCGELVFVVR